MGQCTPRDRHCPQSRLKAIDTSSSLLCHNCCSSPLLISNDWLSGDLARCLGRRKRLQFGVHQVLFFSCFPRSLQSLVTVLSLFLTQSVRQSRLSLQLTATLSCSSPLCLPLAVSHHTVFVESLSLSEFIDEFFKIEVHLSRCLVLQSLYHTAVVRRVANMN